MNKCITCQADTKNAKYCNRSCAAKVNNRVPKRKKKNPDVLRPCGGCGVMRYSPYCNNTCQAVARQGLIISSWLRGEHSGSGSSGHLDTRCRRWLLDEAGHKCSKCGWNEIHPLTKKAPLEVDHINGDWRDNRRENLQVLCPNCHALTPTSKALNSPRSRAKYGLPQLGRSHAREYRKDHTKKYYA